MYITTVTPLTKATTSTGTKDINMKLSLNIYGDVELNQNTLSVFGLPK